LPPEPAPPAGQDRARRAPVLEAEIRRLRARVTELEREKTDVEAFAAVAAHELLAPLMMTEAYAAMVCERLDDEPHADSRRDLETLGRGAARMRLLVEALLHDARSSGRRLRRRPIDLNLVLRECLTLLAPQIRARGADVCVADLPVIRAEETMISVALTNLLSNALRYSPRRGQIAIGATRDNGSWRLSVESQGPPIAVEERQHILEPYHRGRGAGAGSAICRHMVERHGGQIGVSSSNDNRNHFYLTLPA
jgi:two-component system sensor histidine kinase TctE